MRVSKVLCYIVSAEQLLVFRHIGRPWEECGLQVPAGTIRSGETAERAALREAGEETGLTDLRVVHKLGETEYDMTPYRDELQVRQVFQLDIGQQPTPERWSSEENYPGDGGPPQRFECFWIPVSQGHVLSAGQGALLGRIR